MCFFPGIRFVLEGFQGVDSLPGGFAKVAVFHPLPLKMEFPEPIFLIL